MRPFFLRAAAACLLFAAAVLGASCGDDTGGAEGGAGPTVASTTAAPSSTTGNTPIACGDCPPEAPVCSEGICVAQCPADGSVCNTDPGGDLSCCSATEKCCPGALPQQVCAPKTESCPIICGDGTQCADDELCQEDPFTGTYSCTADCQQESECVLSGLPSEIAKVCCPFGSRCEDGACLLPDLSIDQERMASTAEVVLRTPSECTFMEGCVGGPGQRRLLRFDLATPNLGDGDLFLGDPEDSDLFEYSSCHNHFHFKGYAKYTLVDANNVEVGTGEKQAFCLLDYDQWDPGADEAKYHCGFQGISRGWSDIYESNLPCQWVDVTDVPPGSYTLVAEVNFDQILAESDYTNNVAQIPFVIEAISCGTGCGPSELACCGDTDTCGRAENGQCDCGGFQPWDYVDCAACAFCTDATTCPGGCTAASDPCCDPANPCALGTDGICQCAGTQAWDAADCAACVSGDPECAPADSCPQGCPNNSGDACCSDLDNDACGWAGDGYCDCGGAPTWEFMDCSSCACLP